MSNMNNQINELSDKLFKAVDPNDPYTYEEFMREYSNTNEQPNNDLPFFVNLNFVNNNIQNEQQKEQKTEKDISYITYLI